MEKRKTRKKEEDPWKKKNDGEEEITEKAKRNKKELQ